MLLLLLLLLLVVVLSAGIDERIRGIGGGCGRSTIQFLMVLYALSSSFDLFGIVLL